VKGWQIVVFIITASSHQDTSLFYWALEPSLVHPIEVEGGALIYFIEDCADRYLITHIKNI
jgi:hypothetical protein